MDNNIIFTKNNPAYRALNHHLILLLDVDGNVIEDSDANFEHLYFIATQIRKAGNIRKMFRIDASTDLAKLAAEKSVLYGYSDTFDIREQPNPFYTNLPVVTLKLIPQDNKRLHGVVTPSGILPKTIEMSSGGILYLDNSQKVAGFNHTFFSPFSDRYKTPGHLLGLPVSELLSPTPQALQEEILSKTAPPFKLKMTTVCEFDTNNISAVRELKPCGGGTITCTADGFEWVAGNDESSYLVLPFRPDINTTDVAIHLNLKQESTDLPGVVFGDEAGPMLDYDFFGYRLGPDIKNKRMLLKKCGFVIAGCPLPITAFPATQQLTYFKSRDSFLVYKKEQRIFGFHDHDFLNRGTTLLTLFLRPGGRCVLKSIAVSVRPSDASVKNEQFMVKAGEGGHFFLINPFMSFHLNGQNGELSGYHLTEVTDLQTRLNSAEQRYRYLASRYERSKSQFIGSGKAASILKEKAERIAVTKVSVLLQGETGTGKEILARHIHSRSPYAKGPFIKVDCSVLPKTLMESQLFGHEKGAFTGAYHSHTGLFEQAEQGTLFLDEVGNLTHETQTKLLQFLQDFSIMRIGGTKPIQLDIRLIAASNANLSDMVSKGLFREDLYYRMAVVPIHLPPLRQRLDDLPELCREFIQEFSKSHHRNIVGITADGYKKLYAYSWPGNVRELRNVLERAVIFTSNGQIGTTDLDLKADQTLNTPLSTDNRKKKTPFELSREEALMLLVRYRGVIRDIADAIGVSRRTVYYGFKKLGINPNEVRKNPRKSNTIIV
ncbi:MAG: sigma-54-dependent Fis family transcriptional regulator [Fibrobacteres bacterium]|nr:sigma-54-dependent Fis family transcriptional regulator [Fibrobacterota bacterium]